MNLWPQKPVAMVDSHFLLSKGIEVQCMADEGLVESVYALPEPFSSIILCCSFMPGEALHGLAAHQVRL